MKNLKNAVLGLIFAVSLAGQVKAETAAVSAAPSTAAAPASGAPSVKINGFIQSWLDTGNALTGASGGNSPLFAGDFLKHVRLKFSVTPITGVQLVVLPELAGTFTLLDGYAAVNFDQFFMKETEAGPFSITVGQFKTPFGLNRMYLPTQLTSVDYSTVNKGVFGSSSFWDDGLMLTLNYSFMRLDLAAVEGLGPNVIFPPAADPFGFKSNLDYSGRVEFSMFNGSLLAGGSFYYGNLYTTPGIEEFAVPISWFGAHLKWKGPAKTYEVEGEYIQRAQDRFGVNAQASEWIGAFQPFAAYEHVEVYGKPVNNTTRWIAGTNWLPQASSTVRFTAEILAEGAGVSQNPVNTKGILQTQVTF